MWVTSSRISLRLHTSSTPSIGDSKKSYYTGDRTEWEAKNFVTGIDMYETQLEESFFKYKIGLNKLNANPCDRKFDLAQVT